VTQEEFDRRYGCRVCDAPGMEFCTKPDGQWRNDHAKRKPLPTPLPEITR
jgi:hypothetical protein